MTVKGGIGGHIPQDAFLCRDGCGACCIAPSIQQPFYGMPEGKPAGVSCVHLSDEMACNIFSDSRRPDVCSQFAAELSVCGRDRDEALATLHLLELTSRPDTPGNIT